MLSPYSLEEYYTILAPVILIQLFIEEHVNVIASINGKETFEKSIIFQTRNICI